MGANDRDLGFFINEDFNITSTAYLSLALSLKAYASTYKDVAPRFPMLTQSGYQIENKTFYNRSYIEHYSESIIHFQHFAELYIKEILREVHPLLTVDSGKKHALLYKLIKGEEYDNNEIDKLHQIEFSVALERICELIKEGKIDTKYQFIADNRNNLEEVNKLRNRLAHRGIYVRHYKELDVLFGLKILPFVDSALNIYGARFNEYYLKTINGGLSPFVEIINHFKTHVKNYDINFVGANKEIARALYEEDINDFSVFKSFHHHKIKLIESKADFIVGNDGGGIHLETCPVCGLKTLLLYWDWYDDDNGNPAGCYVYEIKCENCTFELDSAMRNIKVGNIDLTTYFKVRTQL